MLEDFHKSVCLEAIDSEAVSKSCSNDENRDLESRGLPDVIMLHILAKQQHDSRSSLHVAGV